MGSQECIGGFQIVHNSEVGGANRSIIWFRFVRACSQSGCNYTEYHGDLVRHSLLIYWYGVGTKFGDCGTNFDELGTKYNPEVIKSRPLSPNTPPAARSAAEGCVFLMY